MIIDIPLTILLLALAASAARFVPWLASLPGQACDWLGKRPAIGALTCAMTALAINLTLALALGLPLPRVHDEFSYLLAGDTFARGRAANPPHQLWEHFESMHILLQPAYASKYPPGQGLFLAAGQIVTGWPIAGIWLSQSLFAAATCWMLFAWTRPRWAIVGGLLSCLHPLMLQWGQTYWGGGVAALGGALFLGGIGRLERRITTRATIACALGLGLLLISRPFEGCLLAGISFGVMIVEQYRQGRRLSRWLDRRILIPGVAILLMTGCGTAYYNWRVTGHPLLFPHVLHFRTYGIAPPLLIQSPNQSAMFRHRELQDFHNDWEAGFYFGQKSVGGFLRGAFNKLQLIALSFAPVLLLQLPAVTVPWLWRRRRPRRALLVCLLTCGAMLIETWMNAHYAAPLAAAIMLLMVEGYRQFHSWIVRRWPAGKGFIPCMLLAGSIVMVLPATSFLGARTRGWPAARTNIQRKLEGAGGRHVILVSYQKGHSVHDEWVYNGADIDEAPVIWARAMSQSENQRLFNYFIGRHFWLLAVGPDEVQLRPIKRSEAGGPMP